MESRSYGESHDFGYSSRSCGERHEIGYSSESRESSESHGYDDGVGFGDPSESAYYNGNYGESHEFYQPMNESSTKKTAKRKQTSNSSSVNDAEQKYNNLEDIDKLIERLENELPSVKSKNVKYNDAISRRKQQIKELKKLRDAAQTQIKEQEMVSQLEKENDEIDEEIAKVKKFLKKYTESKEEDYPF